MRRSIPLWCATVAAVGLCPSVEAADYAYRANAKGDVVLTLSGPITSVDGAVFLHEINRNKPRIVELEGPGGDLLSAVRIGVPSRTIYMDPRHRLLPIGLRLHLDRRPAYAR